MLNKRFEPVPPGLTTGAADRLVRSVLGPLTTGASLGPKTERDAQGNVISRSIVLTVHVLESTGPADITKLEQAVASYGVMTVTADKTAVAADDTDMATITCADARIASDSKVDVHVYLDGALYHEAAVDVVAGSVVLEFATETPGRYLIEIGRRRGTFATGLIQIEAVD